MRLVMTALFLGIFAAPALAAEGDVTLAGQVILRIRFPAAGYLVAQRAEAVGVRLNSVLSMEQVGPQDVAVRQVNRETAVVVRDQLVITVDWPTARFNRTTPEQLAAIWADNLRRVLPMALPRRTGSGADSEFIYCAGAKTAMWQGICANHDIMRPSTG